MTNEDRNLLRAQLLIEAADLLDEGYNKPNTNDKLRAAEQRRLYGGVNKLKRNLDAAIQANDYDKAKKLQKKLNACDPKAMSRATSRRTYGGINNNSDIDVIYSNWDGSNNGIGDSTYFKDTGIVTQGVRPRPNSVSRNAERRHRRDDKDPYASKES